MSAGVGRKFSATGNYGGAQGAGDQRHSAITGTAAGAAGQALFGSRGQQRGGSGNVSEGMDIFETTDVTYRSIGLHNVDVVADADFGSPSLYRSMTQPSVVSRSSPDAMGAGGVSLRKSYISGKAVPGLLKPSSNAALEAAAPCKPELLVAGAAIRAMALPAFPFRLEPRTHFYISNKKCAPVAECLQRCFGAERVDSEFEPDSCHWRCARFASGDYVDLRVTIYACAGGDEGQGERLCVEFRLSRGNRYEFRRVYQASVDALQREGCCLDMPQPLRKLPVPQASRLPVLDISAPGLLPPLPLAPPAPLMRELMPGAAMTPEPNVSTSDEVSPLLSMCRDTCCDTNCEGARLFAQLTSAEDTRASLVRDDVVGALAALVVKGAADADEAAAAAARKQQQQPCAAEVLSGGMEPFYQWRDPAALARVFAVFALSNLSELADCQELIASTDVLPALLALAACGAGGPGYVELEERRECARLLANMSGAFAQQIAKEVADGGKPIKEFLMRCNALHDERLKVHALRVRRLLPESASGTIMAF